MKSTTKVPNLSCSKDLPLEPHLIAIFHKLSHVKNLKRSWFHQKYYWEAWHDSVGEQIRPLYSEFIKLGNKAARNQGYNDMGNG